jgi:hypothetical protein
MSEVTVILDSHKVGGIDERDWYVRDCSVEQAIEEMKHFCQNFGPRSLWIYKATLRYEQDRHGKARYHGHAEEYGYA